MKPVLVVPLVLLLGLGIWYASWSRGTVLVKTEVASCTLKIREIPVHPPGQNSEFAYRCEIWHRGVLFKATTQIADSFIANPKRCRIEVLPSARRAIFHIDGYRITCDGYAIDGDTLSDATWIRDQN